MKLILRFLRSALKKYFEGEVSFIRGKIRLKIWIADQLIVDRTFPILDRTIERNTISFSAGSDEDDL